MPIYLFAPGVCLFIELTPISYFKNFQLILKMNPNSQYGLFDLKYRIKN